MLMSSSLDLTDKESNATALNESGVIFLSSKLLGSKELLVGSLACAKTKRGKHKKRNIRSTFNRFSKGIDFGEKAPLGKIT